MIKSIQDGYNLLFWVFIIICLYGSGNSQQLEEDYTPVANNETMQIRTESNNEWGSISDPSY